MDQDRPRIERWMARQRDQGGALAVIGGSETLPPGRARFLTSPVATGFPTIPTTMGISLGSLPEIRPADLRALCTAIGDHGAPATAIHVRDIVKQTYVFARLKGARVSNPAGEVGGLDRQLRSEGSVARAGRVRLETQRKGVFRYVT